MTELCYLKIKVEPLQPKLGPAECFRCQRFLHFSKFCTRNPKCVKCGQHHLTRNCTKSSETDATCCNCQEAAKAKAESSRSATVPATPARFSTPPPVSVSTSRDPTPPPVSAATAPRPRPAPTPSASQASTSVSNLKLQHTQSTIKHHRNS
ncbi:hypothetical protein TNCV_1920291 [Trichonephila clavipes]|nr:hypothetical protein TNCV_1920291 [Trichonephila clavipes]